MAAPDHRHPEALLAHLDFVRGLARNLLGEQGDDLAQDACVAALQRAPREPARVREWLAVVVRNLARNLRRARQRRERHESRAATAAAHVRHSYDIP